MSINETIIKAVTPIVPVCVPDVYRPDAGETPAEVYCTFNYTESPDVFGDDEPQAIRYLIQLHLYLPLRQTPLRLKRQLRRAMLDAGLAVGDMPTPAIWRASTTFWSVRRWIWRWADGLHGQRA